METRYLPDTTLIKQGGKSENYLQLLHEYLREVQWTKMLSFYLKVVDMHRMFLGYRKN